MATQHAKELASSQWEWFAETTESAETFKWKGEAIKKAKDVGIETDLTAIDATERIQMLDAQRQVREMSLQVNGLIKGGNIQEGLLPRIKEKERLVCEVSKPWTCVIEQRLSEFD